MGIKSLLTHYLKIMKREETKLNKMQCCTGNAKTLSDVIVLIYQYFLL